MERDRSFNFKLFVPPWVNNGQVSAVRPQEVTENCGNFMNTLQEGYSKYFDKEQSTTSPSTSMAAATKPARQEFPKMKAVPPMEKDKSNCNPGQLYSKLFDEVEKMKCWKVKVDTDTVQKERKLQENKRTIETQRKAIQELQFGNESLSIKLEEQISENEDLTNKNNATRNMCNILKDTFQRSAEKMHLFESERQETHQLFIENSGGIQKLITAFESLRTRAEADQQEMQKVKEDLLQFEDLKMKYHQEYNMKEKEAAVLQTKLKDKENELQKILLDFHETQKHCKQLEEATNKQHELLKSSKTEQESLLQELHTAEQRCKETEKKCEAIAAMLEQSKEECTEMIQTKDLNLEELSRVKNQQADMLEQIQTTIQKLQNSLALEIQRAKELENKLTASNKELDRSETLLGETTEQCARKDGQITVLEDELDRKSNTIESMKGKIDVAEVRVEELTAELSRKTKEAQLLKNEAEVAFAENDLLKKACEAAEKAQEDLKEKSTVTEITVQELQEQLFIEKKKNEERTFEMDQLRKDVTQHEVRYKEILSDFNELQSEKTAIQQQFNTGCSHVKAIEANMKVSEGKVLRLTREIQRLEKENNCLREEVNSIKTIIQGEHQGTEALQKKIEENCEHLLEEITEKEKQIKAVETKLCGLRKKIMIKLKAQEEYQKENKMLKKQIAKEIAKSSQLEIEINSLHEESRNFKKLNEENCQKLLKDLESQSTTAADLRNEIQQLRLTTAEAIKSKEDIELKCKHKITDMVTLMEKHKSRYDRMVEEKDAELDENKKKEMAAVAQRRSLLPAANCKQGLSSETPKKSSSKRHVFDFSKTKKTPSYSKDDGRAANMRKAEIHSEDLKTPITNRVGGTSKIKSYRIRTPPSALGAGWGKRAIELDPKSDSSDQNDVLSFASAPAPSIPALCKLNILQKIQSPVTHKSPGNSLKLAAMKRMRDAGWTAVTGCDKKKKRSNENIFA
ncbi:synaptonemal complex protein 1 isoform X2 [Chelmon rostratus]|uniref:synaptonemal complex protein 1 isoform X2 n=1 Tax=Chelmon rostratus TaxID=109905 RepID=UPI001BEB7758|nr:synaptonemal complex protein 1 isoform X2 [Chelmon rostratus]